LRACYKSNKKEAGSSPASFALTLALVVVVAATAAATTIKVAVATTATTAITVSATAATATTTTVATAITTTVATAITTAAEAAPAAGWAILFGLSKVNFDRAAIQRAAVQSVHGVLCAVLGRHLDKAKALAAAAHAIHHHFRALHFTGTLKVGAQSIIVCGVGQVAYIQSRSSHISPDYWLD
jgi:hypothetical protein